MTNLKLLISAVMLFLFVNLFSQTKGMINLKEDGTFEIPNNELSEVYHLDISSLNFNSFESAIENLSNKNTELILFRPNSDGTVATVFLQLGKKPQWTVSNWNSAISEITFP